MIHTAKALAVLSALFTAAIAGFFYAWVCSTLWGLDQAAPATAIEAMQSMNASVRNAVFFPAFFLTPVVTGLAGIVAFSAGARSAALALIGASIVYVLGAFLPTAMVNVPMNEALAEVSLDQPADLLSAIWSAYSVDWQWWNGLRTVMSMISVLLVAIALLQFPAPARIKAR